jgi:uncharacterized NAD-dependent epimerase/dehydratase family protein
VDGDAVVWCGGAFGTANGKTAHGLVRSTARYRVRCVVDPTCAGRDAGELLGGASVGIPVVATVREAIERFSATYLVIGLAPDGGRLPPEGRAAVAEAIEAGLNVDSGLHDFLGDDPVLAARAQARGVVLRDVRRTPDRRLLHSFSGRIREVAALKVAVLGTDSAVGKRTTCTLLVAALNRRGIPAQMVGTGQTAWMQGVKHGLILDSMINDFLAGELEHATVAAWEDGHPRVICIEGQGSLLNPAYPGGYEILAACRPEKVVMQHAPTRREYDGFPGFEIEPIEKQIAVVEAVSKARVAALTLNHEGLAPDQIAAANAELTRRTGLPCCDPLVDGLDPVIDALIDGPAR